MNILRIHERQRDFGLMLWLFALAISWQGPDSSARAQEAVSVRSLPDEAVPDEKAPVKKIEPDRFHEVDEAARILVWLVAVCGVGAVVLLSLIVVGARRLRKLTRSTALKSKYDELEALRARYRQEVEGLDTPPPPNREARR